MDSNLMLRLVDLTKRINTLANLAADSKRAIQLGVDARDIRHAKRAVAELTPLLMGMNVDPLDKAYATTPDMLAKEAGRLFDDLCAARTMKTAHAVNRAITELTSDNAR